MQKIRRPATTFERFLPYLPPDEANPPVVLEEATLMIYEQFVSWQQAHPVRRLPSSLKKFLARIPFLLWICLAILPDGNARGVTFQASSITPPKPEREFRAAWVATVGNIDWPSKKGLSTVDQKAELVAIMDRAASLSLNAIIFQVRPACDALYASELEPWSEYLTGVMGRAPEPFYDPLAFAVDEAHKRGLELHAWFNPYRAGHPSAKSPVSANHITKTRPQLVKHYGKQLWLDPGEKEVQDYSLGVIMDVARRYDIDGVHLDDYFYPYKENNSEGVEMDFPDDASWRHFGPASKLTRDDWRRENVNMFIQRTYSSLKGIKPWVKFGVSPFGIWRPGYPAQIKGFDAYASLYADSRKWLSKGWVDYFAPQLYWAIDSKEQSFPVLLKWWGDQNPKHRPIYPGLDATKTRSRPEGSANTRRGVSWNNEEIVNQIKLTRKQPGAEGDVLWNMKSLMRNESLGQALKQSVYLQPALMPASPWLGNAHLAPPVVTATGGESGSSLRLVWSSSGGSKPWLWLVQTRAEGVWKTEILPASKTSLSFSATQPDAVAVTAVDRNGNASKQAVMARKIGR